MAFWAAFFKGRRRAHQRQYESGKTGWVRETQTKQTKKPKPPGGQGALFGEKGQPTKAARQAAQPAPAAKQPMSKKQGKPKTIPVSERSGATEIRVTDKGNKQYLYDKKHEQESHEKKLARMKALGTHLPEIVDWCSDRLDLPGAPKEKVIAALVALMDRCYFRIGLARYAEENQTYGVSTLRPDHVTVDGDEIAFSFVGKKQVQWDRTVTDPRLARFVGELQAGAPGDSLFWYEEGGERKPITADDVNDYLKQYGVTAKDIRTYHATRLAFDALKKGGRQPDEEPLKGRALGRAFNQAIASVAAALGHEVSVCKKSYILPQLTKNFTENGGMFVVGDEVFGEHLQAMEPVQLSVRAAAALNDPARGKLAIGAQEQEFLRFLAAIGGSPVRKGLIAVVFGNTVALMKGRVRGHYKPSIGKFIPTYTTKKREAIEAAGQGRMFDVPAETKVAAEPTRAKVANAGSSPKPPETPAEKPKRRVTNISVETDGDKVLTHTPYHPGFVAGAKKLNGKWNSATKTWAFDARDEANVRKLCMDVYGTDGEEGADDLVDLRVPLLENDLWREQTLYLGGRQIAHRQGRDDPVRLGDGVVVVEGAFPASGGSRKSPELANQLRDPLVVEIRDLPRRAAERVLKREGAEIIGGDSPIEGGIDKDALREEAKRLRTRLAEIEQLLKE
jgi:hypothetical protein